MDTSAIKEKIADAGDTIVHAGEWVVSHDFREQVIDRLYAGKRGVDHTLETFGIKKNRSLRRKLISTAKRPGTIAIVAAIFGAYMARPPKTKQ